MKIEKCFIVSLPERLTDRLIPLIDYAKKIDLDYNVWQATKMEDGKLGLLASMESLFTFCIKNNYGSILVLEDDCKFIVDNPKEIISKCLEQLPNTYECLFLGCNLWQIRVRKYSQNLIQLEDAYATHAVIYSKEGISKVLTAIQNNKRKLPLDLLIKEVIMPQENCFCSFPILTSQADGYSDIEKKKVKYSKFIEERFYERTKHL